MMEPSKGKIDLSELVRGTSARAASMSDRKAELERKKAKLQALRDEKDRRRREKEQKDAEEAVRAVSMGGGGGADSRRDVDELLSSIGLAPVRDVLSSLSSLASLTPSQPEDADASLPPHDKAPHAQHHKSPKKAVTLSIVSVQATDIPPKELVNYSKQTQTAGAAGNDRDAHATDYYVLTFDDERGGRQGEEEESLGGAGFHRGVLPPGILAHGLPQVKEVQPAVTEPEPRPHVEEPKDKKVRELSADEKQTIMLSPEFQRFISRAGRLVERALAETVDIYTDYTGVTDLDHAQDDKGESRLSLVRTFSCERWSRGRCVTSVAWSPVHPELVLAAYHNSDDAPHDPDGVCLVWNTKFKKTTPEDVFHCQSPVMSATFARFNPNLILGGTYSGQIVLWDNRVQKRTPIQRTPLSSQAHTHPVYCLNVVGSQNAHNLISVSTDGRLCSWSLDMLGAPQETLDLQHRQNKAVAVTCMDFPLADHNNFVLGSEDGNLYTGCRHGGRAGVTEALEGHWGPVTSVSYHCASGPVDYSPLCLSTSMDWSVRLWSGREGRQLYAWEGATDYVLEARWSPAHPAVFAAIDAASHLHLWNLNRDTEVSGASVQCDPGAVFNRVSWAGSGALLAAGDDNGKIYLYDVAENLSQPRNEEWTRFGATLNELKNNQADEEQDRLALASTGPPSLASLTSIGSNPLR